MKIEVLGTGCSKCQNLFNNATQAVAKSGKFAQVTKVEEMQKILEYGVTSTPALVINGEVKSSGRIPDIDEIVSLM